MNGWVVVRTSSFPIEAHVACSARSAAAIDAEVIDHHAIALDWQSRTRWAVSKYW